MGVMPVQIKVPAGDGVFPADVLRPAAHGGGHRCAFMINITAGDWAVEWIELLSQDRYQCSQRQFECDGETEGDLNGVDAAHRQQQQQMYNADLKSLALTVAARKTFPGIRWRLYSSTLNWPIILAAELANPP